MAEKSQQSRATVYRRLDALQSSGLLVLFPRWIDENGKIWSASAPGRRRTSPEIRLQFGVLIKQAAPPDEAETDEEVQPPQSQAETGLSHCSDDVVSLQRRGSSHCSDNNHHLNRKEDSPPPPSGGGVAVEDWKEFEDAWIEPILRQSSAQQVWASLKPDERALAKQAARGYVMWRKSQKRPPNVLGAHLFLKERDAWAKFAAIAPAGTSSPSGYRADSPESRAVAVVCEIARKPDAHRTIFVRGEVLHYSHPISRRMLALAEAPRRDKWPVLRTRQQAAAWESFLRDDTAIQPLRPLREGDIAPWPWPPRVDGTLSPDTTGPPSGLSDDDAADFR